MAFLGTASANPPTTQARKPAESVTAPPSLTSYTVRTPRDGDLVVGDGPPAFVVRARSIESWRRLWRLDTYRAGMAFLRGDFEIEGDLVAAVEVWWRRAPRRSVFNTLLAILPRVRPERWIQSRARARRNIQFHYDRSNDFYRTFLDRRQVYSCAYFEHATQTLDQAQEAKLDHVCRKLDLHAGDSFLDVGCGWGALMAWAVERYGVTAVGCTASRQQHESATRMFGERGLAGRARAELCDYRDVGGRFTKIASVGMVEHVGRSRLASYFGELASRLDDAGLLLNHGITRPSTVRGDATSHFLQRRVFPGGELVSLDAMIHAAEAAGFEVLDVENLRPHYARTCRAWVERLQANRQACLSLVDVETYRTWLLYLAASAACFEQGLTDVYQLLLAKRSGTHARHATRRYMYPAL
jgi:cyclopropane-fatty-acyl-phospholipid synthase